jgi:hypothetical protein
MPTAETVALVCAGMPLLLFWRGEMLEEEVVADLMGQGPAWAFFSLYLGTCK